MTYPLFRNEQIILYSDGGIHSRSLRCHGGRQQVRREAVAQALAGLLDLLSSADRRP